MKSNSKKTWFIVEKIPDVSYIMPYPIIPGYGKRLTRLGAGKHIQSVMWIMRDGDADLCYIKEELHQFSESILKKVVRQPEWLKMTNKLVETSAREYLRYIRSLIKIDLSKLSNKDLWNRFDQLFRHQVESHGKGQATTWLIEAEQNFSNYLLERLTEQKRLRGLRFDIRHTFSLLTTPLKFSFTMQESQEALLLAKEIVKDTVAVKVFQRKEGSQIKEELNVKRPQLLKKLEQHQQKWFWLHYSYRGPILKLEYFLEIWQELIREARIGQRLREVMSSVDKTKKEQQILFRNLRFDRQTRLLYEQARYIVWLKAYRKDCMYFGAYVSNQFVKEVARRLYISFNQAEYMIPDEFKDALLKGQFDVKELSARRMFSVVYGTWDDVKIYSGDRARKFLKSTTWERQKRQKVAELVGQTACPGKACGIVKIIETVKDMHKMKKGNIMLSETTYPALVPAMRKAAAIVTNVGGLTCHAAIVSRELKIPCVVGTKIATQVLYDGQKVEVDASKGIVRIIK